MDSRVLTWGINVKDSFTSVMLIKWLKHIESDYWWGGEQKMQLLGEQRQNQDWPGLHHQRFPPFQMHSVLFCCKWAEMQNRWYGSRKQCNHLPNYHCSNNSTVTAAKTGIKQKRETACTRRQTASAPQPPRNWHFREDDLQLFCCGDTIIIFPSCHFPE